MKSKRKLLILSLLIALSLVAVWVIPRSMSPKFTPPPLPSPNGFDSLLRAAQMLHTRTGFYDEMSAEELESVVEHNAPALEIARQALTLECGVPIDWTWNPAAKGPNPALLDQVQAMRALARGFGAEIRAKLSAGDASGAMQSGIDTYRLGVECNRGGLIVGHLVGIAIRSKAIDELRSALRQDPNLREEILTELLPLLETNEPGEEVIQRETDYIVSASTGLMGWFIVRQTEPLRESAIKAFRQTEKRGLATQRLFVLHLALKKFHEENGSWPTSLSQLSPNLIQEVLVDPYSQSSFIYETRNEGYALYSVGENKKDDGGIGDETGQKPDVMYELHPDDESSNR